jgi:hypothetical protein
LALVPATVVALMSTQPGLAGFAATAVI